MDVKTLCLGVLTLGDASGYEIKKSFEEGPFAYFYKAGFGSIYPALDALREEGLVTCQDTPQEGRPGKKVYSIAPAGWEALKRALRKDPVPDVIRSEYMFMIFFAELMDPDHLSDIFDRYLAFYRSRAEFVRGLDNTGISKGRRFGRGFGLAFYESAVRYMEENRHLILDDGADTENDEPRLKAGGAR